MSDTFVGIIAAGRYPHEMPIGLREILEDAIRSHMESYGLRNVTVITEEDDIKRAYAKELYSFLKDAVKEIEEHNRSYNHATNFSDLEEMRALLAEIRSRTAAPIQKA